MVHKDHQKFAGQRAGCQRDLHVFTGSAICSAILLLMISAAVAGSTAISLSGARGRREYLPACICKYHTPLRYMSRKNARTQKKVMKDHRMELEGGGCQQPLTGD